jgi:hypothetical protein
MLSQAFPVARVSAGGALVAKDVADEAVVWFANLETKGHPRYSLKTTAASFVGDFLQQ